MRSSIPSPSQGVWHLGPFPVRAYAMAILLGVVVAVVLTRRRLVARGGRAEQVDAIAAWAVPFGLVGGRLYHVLTDPELYFGAGQHPIRALYVWQGGLGIWGAVALGAVGAWIGCRRHGVRLLTFADAAAPGIVLAQALGRFGNYFNQELYGRPSQLPWALQIDHAHRPSDTPSIATYQPTFLYEVLWNVAVAGCCCGQTVASGSVRARSSRCTSPCTQSAGPGSSTYAWTTPTICSACGSTTGPA